MTLVATFDAHDDFSEVQFQFHNYEDARGKISGCILTIDGEQFQISSDTATYHRLLGYFRTHFPSSMKNVYDAAPRLR